MFFGWLEKKIAESSPARRRRMAIHLLFWSVVAMIVNVALYLVKVIDQSTLILITLVLSWFAITLTAADLVATTDVREVTEEDG